MEPRFSFHITPGLNNLPSLSFCPSTVLPHLKPQSVYPGPPRAPWTEAAQQLRVCVPVCARVCVIVSQRQEKKKKAGPQHYMVPTGYK